MSDDRGQDHGFTLVELLVAVVILAVITGSLAGALVVSLRTTDEATTRLGLAHDLQISTATFASDVQSADSVWETDPAPGCGPSGSLLLLRWDDGGVLNVVAYALQTASGQQRLVRHHCRTGAPDAQQVLSHFVGASGPVTCTPAAAVPPSCGTVLTPVRPRQVAVQLTSSSGAVHVLRGTRRTYA